MRNLIVVLFLFLSVNVFSQVKHDFDKLSRMVFDEINLERKKAGLMEAIWSDTLLEISKTTNRILKNDNKLYHPSICQNRDTLNYYEKMFVNQYKKLTSNENFEYKSADAWGFIRDYTQIGEVIGLYYNNTLDTNIVKDVVKRWLNSKGHRFWVLIHNTLVYDEPYPIFCSCDSNYKLYNNEQYIIVTCNFYVVNIKSEWYLD
jgi:uncharacterized protein YkwD